MNYLNDEPQHFEHPFSLISREGQKLIMWEEEFDHMFCVESREPGSSLSTEKKDENTWIVTDFKGHLQIY